jgi:hypothetical protein
MTAKQKVEIGPETVSDSTTQASNDNEANMGGQQSTLLPALNKLKSSTEVSLVCALTQIDPHVCRTHHVAQAKHIDWLRVCHIMIDCVCQRN